MISNQMATQIITPPLIIDVRHPYYNANQLSWQKWRLTYQSGELYMDQYLRKFTDIEDDIGYKERRSLSYVPSMAKTAVLEVRNAIYERFSDISRTSGTASYQQCVNGQRDGVDLISSSMNTFMGIQVLPELLFMGRVGIYVDMPPKGGYTLADNIKIRPYLYIYQTEDILSWLEDEGPSPNGLKGLLIRDHNYTNDETTGLPSGETEGYRLYRKLDDGTVSVTFYNESSDQLRAEILQIPEIPFIMADLGMSLLNDIDDYQIGLLNLASADMQYCRNANFPMYTEQFDPKYQSPHLKREEGDALVGEEIKVGSKTGRRYPVNTERPGFIAPPDGPIRVSMAKQEQMKAEIREILHLSLATLGQKAASAESKQKDRTPMEAGMAYIGLVMQDTETRIGRYWSMYEGAKDNPTIIYPTQYSLKSDEQRFNEVDKLQSKLSAAPSLTYKKEISKKIAYILLRDRVSPDTMTKIYGEIDKATVPVVIPELVDKHVAGGFLSPDDAAAGMGYPDDTVTKSQKFQAERLKLIRDSQTANSGGPGGSGPDFNAGARGVTDQSVNPTDQARQEKQQAQQDKITAGQGGTINNRGQGAVAQ